jgi:hypothetical protein
MSRGTQSLRGGGFVLPGPPLFPDRSARAYISVTSQTHSCKPRLPISMLKWFDSIHPQLVCCLTELCRMLVKPTLAEMVAYRML